MKKSFLAICLISSLFMGGCQVQQQEVKPVEPVTNEESDDEISAYKIGLAPVYYSKESYLSVYVDAKNTKEVENHYNVESNYIFLDKENIGYNPKFFVNKEGDVVVWFTSSEGQLFSLVEGQSYSKRKLLGNAHCYDKDMDVTDYIIECSSSNLIKVSKEGIVSLYEFGKETNRWEIPKDSEYCGESYWEGHIFLDKQGNVYALRIRPMQMVKIAENVDRVLTCNYQFTLDYFSQPLFRMKDKSIKVYLNPEEKDFDKYKEHLYEIDDVPKSLSERKIEELDREEEELIEEQKRLMQDEKIIEL